jgi:GNAT superfamily N-acetyltransferase
VKPSAFWATQPVDERAGLIPFGSGVTSLPSALRFVAFDPRVDVDRLQRLLDEHYVEAGSFRLQYSADLLRWALTPPDHVDDWCVAIEDTQGELGGFVFAAPATVSIDGESREAVIVNFLCVRRDLRNLGLGPLLINEITRRVVERGRDCALFSAAVRLPMEPLAACRYLCRFLHPGELVERGYVARPAYLTAEQFERIYALPEETIALQRVTEPDLPAVVSLWAQKTSPVRLQPAPDDLRHALLGRAESWLSRNDRGEPIAVASYFRATLRHAASGIAIQAAFWYHAFASPDITGPLFDAVCRRAADGGAQILFALDAGPLAALGPQHKVIPTGHGLRFHTFNWRVSPHPARAIELPTV